MSETNEPYITSTNEVYWYHETLETRSVVGISTYVEKKKILRSLVKKKKKNLNYDNVNYVGYFKRIFNLQRPWSIEQRKSFLKENMLSVSEVFVFLKSEPFFLEMCVFREHSLKLIAG